MPGNAENDINEPRYGQPPMLRAGHCCKCLMHLGFYDGKWISYKNNEVMCFVCTPILDLPEKCRPDWYYYTDG